MDKNKNIRYEFFKYQSTTLGGSFTNTLVFENVLSIEFILTGTALGNGTATINNTYSLKLSNQFGEIDKTVYTIQLNNVCDLTVIVKFKQ